MSEDSDSSSTEEPTTNLTPFPSAVKHIHFDEEQDDTGTPSMQQVIERPTPSTIRIDGSDLISRCKDFLPLLADPNTKSSIDEDKTDEDFPEIVEQSSSDQSSKESGEASSTNDDEKQNEITKKKRKKKKKKKKKKLKTTDDIIPDVHVQT